jgi:predicted membrane GTPase involved in stress response
MRCLTLSRAVRCSAHPAKRFEGMIVGEHNRDNDLNERHQAKKLSNMRIKQG